MSLSSTKTPSKPSKTGGGPIASEKQKCPEIKYELMDFVEVVTQDEEKWVEGAARAPKDKSVMKKGIERKDKDKDGNFKQFINLGKDIEDQAQRHPEYGREITFKARIKREDGKKEKLNGIKILFKNKCKKAGNRENPDTKVWSDAGLINDQKEGFGSKNGTAATTVQTDAKGWTSPVSFFLSQYGGDIFEITAQLDPSVKASKRRPPKRTKKYITWRKFWYQMTYADGFAAVKPEKAADAFAEVFADMEYANEKKFKKEDFKTDLQDRTFYPEYQLKKGGGNKIIANVGDNSNINEFKTKEKLKLKEEAKHPAKGNLIICESQCDPIGQTPSAIYKMEAKIAQITLSAGKLSAPIVSKPALKAGAKLVVEGKWSLKNEPDWATGGTIPDSCIEVFHGRASTLTVKVHLDKGKGATGDPPVPTDVAPVFIKLKVEAGKSYSGWATSAGIVAVYDPAIAAGKSGSKEDFNDTVAHEFGHRVNQTPEEAKKNLKALKDHPKQYAAHGGSGSHCRHGVTDYIMNNASGWSENELNFHTTIKNDPSKNKNTHEVVDAAHFNKLIGQNLKVDTASRKLKAVNGSKLVFTTSFEAAKDWTVKYALKTKIKKAEASAKTIHEVVDATHFNKIEGQDILVNGVKKTLKKVHAGNKLEFTSGFTSTKDSIVAYTLETKIKNDPSTDTNVHEVVSVGDFKYLAGRKIWVAGVPRKLKAVTGSKLVFKDEFTVAKNAKVENKVNWQDRGEKDPSPTGGDCIMFHSYTEKCSHKFCDQCKPYLQLQDMSTL